MTDTETALTTDIPAEQPAERDALLFRAGVYPGKGLNGSALTITESDLQAIAENTDSVPLIFAHDAERERLDFGTVGGLEARGNELWGKVRLAAESVSFVAKNGLRSLSVGLDYADKRLKETSFTRRPHIKDATMFSESDSCAVFSVGEEPKNSFDAGEIVEFAEAGEHWVTIEGEHVLLKGTDVDHETINRAVAKHGVPEAGAKVLHDAHDAGKIKTDEHLYRSIATGTNILTGGANEPAVQARKLQPLVDAEKKTRDARHDEAIKEFHDNKAAAGLTGKTANSMTPQDMEKSDKLNNSVEKKLQEIEDTHSHYASQQSALESKAKRLGIQVGGLNHMTNEENQKSAYQSGVDKHGAKGEGEYKPTAKQNADAIQAGKDTVSQEVASTNSRISERIGMGKDSGKETQYQHLARHAELTHHLSEMTSKQFNSPQGQAMLKESNNARQQYDNHRSGQAFIDAQRTGQDTRLSGSRLRNVKPEPAKFSLDTPILLTAQATRATKGRLMPNLITALLDRLRGKDLLSDEEIAQFTADAHAQDAQFEQDEQTAQTALFAEVTEAKAETAYGELFAAGKILPPEKPGFIADFCQLASDDRRSPAVITFSDGEKEVKASRVERLKARYADRDKMAMFKEVLDEAPQDALVLFNAMKTKTAGAEKPVTPERIDQLLAMTSEGRAILAERGK